MRRLVDWFFRDRRTGRIVIGQRPNAALWIFAGASAVEWLIGPEGGFGTVVAFVRWASLAVWAVDEVFRGVNPWRRCLGAAVLAFLAARAWA